MCIVHSEWNRNKKRISAWPSQINIGDRAHSPAPMFLIGVFTDEPARLRGFRKAGGDSSLELVVVLSEYPLLGRVEARGHNIEPDQEMHCVLEMAI